MGPAASGAGADLAALLTDDDPAVRLDAAAALTRIEGEKATETIPVLIRALRVEKIDDSAQTAARDRAAHALARVGKPAVKPLLDALEGDFAAGGADASKGVLNGAARLGVVQALGEMGPAANEYKVLYDLGEAARKDPFSGVRDAAKRAFDAINKGEKAATPSPP
jgi:HEAT repeat protein